MSHKHRSHRRGGRPVRRPQPVVLVAALFLGAALLTAAIWFLGTRDQEPVQAAMVSPELRERTARLVEHSSSIRLTPEQQSVKREALAGIPAPCGDGNSLAMACCRCNLGKSIGGLASELAAGGADVGRVREAVHEWLAETNPSGYSGTACSRKRCERPFHADGCGGMKDRLVF